MVAIAIFFVNCFNCNCAVIVTVTVLAPGSGKRPDAVQVASKAGPSSAKDLLKILQDQKDLAATRLAAAAAEAERLKKRANRDEFEQMLASEDEAASDEEDREAYRLQAAKQAPMGLSGGSLGKQDLPAAKAAGKSKAKAAKKVAASLLASMETESTTASAPSASVAVPAHSTKSSLSAKGNKPQMDAEMAIVAEKHNGTSKCLEGFTPAVYLTEPGSRIALGAKTRGVRRPVDPFSRGEA